MAAVTAARGQLDRGGYPTNDPPNRVGYSAGAAAVSDEDYFQYGAHQDPVTLRAHYLQTALQISTTEDGWVYLLNPQVVDERGEWEAWDFGTKLAGADRYRSFWELLQAVCQRELEELSDEDNSC